MFKSKQYRAEAAEYGAAGTTSAVPTERRRYKDFQDRLNSLAANEQGLAETFDRAVVEQNRSRGATLAGEEEHVLRCLGAAVIMQWSALPTTVQREIFDSAASVGKLLETEALRGQIARFLHKNGDGSDGH